MSEVHERLQEARRLAGFESASDAARAHGWNENTYRSHENGERGIKPSISQRYAEAFSVSLAWLVTGEGEISTTSLVSVRGFVESDNTVRFEDPESVAYLEFFVPQYAIACIINTDAFHSKYSRNDLILCWKSSITDKALEKQILEGIAEVEGREEYIFGTLMGMGAETQTLELIGAPPLREVIVSDFYPVQVVARIHTFEEATPTGTSKRPLGRKKHLAGTSSTKRTE